MEDEYKATGDKKYLNQANFWFDWFSGNNITNQVMIDKKTTGVFDGLCEHSLNPNQGAESIVCYLLAYLEMVNLNQTMK
jgi:hypothetical protein